MKKNGIKARLNQFLLTGSASKPVTSKPGDVTEEADDDDDDAS